MPSKSSGKFAMAACMDETALCHHYEYLSIAVCVFPVACFVFFAVFALFMVLFPERKEMKLLHIVQVFWETLKLRSSGQLYLGANEGCILDDREQIGMMRFFKTESFQTFFCGTLLDFSWTKNLLFLVWDGNTRKRRVA